MENLKKLCQFIVQGPDENFPDLSCPSCGTVGSSVGNLVWHLG